ncbi:hypothetical protein N8D56_04060 [Devosia sp. A8/3-2]|nr:hypothetical protein N8D56_04060 [Devosia sp. A8/3-2]
MSDTAKRFVQTQLARTQVEIGGSRPRDVQVHNESLYGRVLSQGTLGLGESYMDGWWDAEALDQFLFKLITANIQDNFPKDWP